MSLEIYKLYYLKDNAIEKIQVYNGSNEQQDLSTIFDNDELTNIETNNIPIEFIDSYIYLDDTIETIKRKIISNNIDKAYYDIALETIYLFCAYKEQLTTISVYENITQRGTLKLNRIRLLQFLTNIGKPEYIDKLDATTEAIYTYDDLLQLDLNLDTTESIVNKALGEKFVAGNMLFPFQVNPYNVTAFDPFLKNNASMLITTTNKSLLMTNFGANQAIYKNTIYV